LLDVPKMMKVVALVCLMAVASMAITEKEYRASFLKFIKDNGKHYSQAEFAGKFRTFKSNMDFIASWNANADNHRVGINKFADLTVAEFSAMYLGTRATVTPGPYVPSSSANPTSVDWRTKGAVTPIKDQGQCGSCWAFSAVASTEGAHFLAKGKLVSLSEQNLVDCSGSEGNQGCNGGLMTQAFDYIKSNNGIDTEASYPYKAQDGTCHFSVANVGSTLTSYSNVASGNENALATSIVAGPTSVAIDASHSSFQLYTSGIYYEPACSSSALDHGVTAVGYGVTGSKDFYIVKNSWGTSWGMSGYIEMSRNRNNNCGIATMASLASDT